MDNILILENVVKDIKITKNADNKYVFEGLFTAFDVKNENGRFYSKAMMAPHINRLQTLVGEKKLLGELDHPKEFSIKLSRASHIIESITMDEANNSVNGKIRLLNTERGRDAQAIADAGVPLHISSRASGRIDEQGNVHIGKLYTYDLVADPGFKEAQLRAVNEGMDDTQVSDIMKLIESLNDYNFNSEDDKVELKEISESLNVNNDTRVFQIIENKKTNSNNMNDVPKLSKTNEQYASADAITKWSADIVGVLTTIQEANKQMKTELEELKSQNVANESIDSLKADFNERMNIQDTYLNYLKESVETVGTNEENLRNYAEGHLKESIENVANYAEGYLKENLENVGTYAEGYLKENLENVGTYAEGHLKESIQTVANYTEGYIKENLENVANYAEGHLRESIQSLANGDVKIDENKKENKKVINKVDESKLQDFKSSINSKIEAIKESVKNQNADSKNAEVINENKTTENEKPLFKFMPENIKAKWAGISEGHKKKVLTTADNYIIETKEAVETFWSEVALTENVVKVTDKQIAVVENKDNGFEYNINFDDLIKESKRF